MGGQVATRVIRPRVTRKGPEALTCTSGAGQREFGTVLATLVRYDVLIFTYSDVRGWARRAAGSGGKPIGAVGRLTQTPGLPISLPIYTS